LSSLSAIFRVNSIVQFQFQQQKGQRRVEVVLIANVCGFLSANIFGFFEIHSSKKSEIEREREKKSNYI
jgi:hypothetical protein